MGLVVAIILVAAFAAAIAWLAHGRAQLMRDHDIDTPYPPPNSHGGGGG